MFVKVTMFRPKFTISTVYCKNKNTIKLNLDTRIIITSTQDNVGEKNTKKNQPYTNGLFPQLKDVIYIAYRIRNKNPNIF